MPPAARPVGGLLPSRRISPAAERVVDGKKARDRGTSRPGPVLRQAEEGGATHGERLDDAQLQVHLTTTKPSNKRATEEMDGQPEIELFRGNNNLRAGGERGRVTGSDGKICEFQCAARPRMGPARKNGLVDFELFSRTDGGWIRNPLSQRVPWNQGTSRYFFQHDTKYNTQEPGKLATSAWGFLSFPPRSLQDYTLRCDQAAEAPVTESEILSGSNNNQWLLEGAVQRRFCVLRGKKKRTR